MGVEDFATEVTQRGGRVRMRAGNPLVEISSAPVAADVAEELGVVILGLEGFDVEGTGVVPLLDYIADFGTITGSWAERVHASARAARRVLPHWLDGPALVEFALEDDD